MMNCRLQLLSGLTPWRILTLVFLYMAPCGLAEDPIVVHYSDPSLGRMEAQIGITPAQKARFEDIVVTYRDPENNTDAGHSTQGTARTGRRGGGRGSTQGEAEIPSQGEPRAPFKRVNPKVSREELDELATILTPAQIKKFQDLNGATGKKRHATQ
jgi:hypothetical protein